MDALSQAIEPYWCINSKEESRMYARRAIVLVLSSLVENCTHPELYVQTRLALAEATHLAGKAINITKTGVVESGHCDLKNWWASQSIHFLRDGCKHPKFILTPAIYNSQPNPETIYYEYSYRWRIEEAHRDLKQQFSLSRGRVRAKTTVQGFICLIYGVYSLFLITRQNGQFAPLDRMTAPQYQDAAIEFLYYEQGEVLG